VGEKTTCAVQVPPAFRVADAQLSVSVKSPVVESLPMVSVPPPAFETVTVCGGEATPSPMGAKVSIAGEAITSGGPVPVPERATVCVRNGSDTDSTPVIGPAAEGANATARVQLECPASMPPQLFTTVKLPLTIAAAMGTRAASPVFVSVRFCAAETVPYPCGAKLRASGERLSVAGARPVPARAALGVADCEPDDSAMVNLPLRAPAAVGEKTSVTVHPTPGARVAPQVFAVIAKSPETIGAPSVAGTPPMFEIAIFCPALDEPTTTLPKLALDGVSTICAGASPVPLRGTVCGCGRDWSPTIRVPVIVPAVVGSKPTVSAHCECPGSDVPQPFASVKLGGEIAVWTPVSRASPEFVSRIVCPALAVPTCCAAKVRLTGESVSVAGAAPVPVSVAVNTPDALGMVNVPVRVPEAVGIKTIPTEHCAPALSAVPQ
jgi:hypothetical protein